MNLLVIMSDSLRPDRLGCYGNKKAKTPNIDALAKRSVLFTNAVAEYPITNPARTALFCGIFTFVLRPWAPLRDDDVTLAQILGDTGMVTGVITDQGIAKAEHLDRGFENYIFLPGGKNELPIKEGVETDMSGTWFPPHAPQIDIDSSTWMRVNRQLYMESEGLYFPDLITRRADQWLEEHSGSDFFLWLDYFDPHEPWDPPAPYNTMYTNEPTPVIPKPSGPSSDWMTQEQKRHVMAMYDGTIAQIDEQIGVLVKKLSDLGIAEKTILVLVSDHGEPLGEHGIIRKFGVPLYDELIKIPLIIHDPRFANQARHVDCLVQNVDFMPSMLGLLGVNCPVEHHGYDLGHIIRGSDEGPRRKVFSGAFGGARVCVFDGKWKFIDNRGEKPNELYNLLSDPQEHHNRADKEPRLVRQFHRNIWDFQNEVVGSTSGVIKWLMRRPDAKW
ncbi:MAG: sulfatase [Desulfobacteraceae bacterium]|nr:sulfatase [Desulfobacteraceae bacterium]